jgi:lipopolysaccharide export system protein LptA
MKHHHLVAVAMLGGLLVHAQTNTPGVLPTPLAPTINSESADFDLNGHQGIWRGYVRVDDPQMKLTCERLVADMPPAGGRPNHIVAETNVVIDFTDTKGQTNHATGDKAVYVYSEQGSVTNKTVTLTGNPQIENAQGTQAGDVIILDLANNKVHFDNPHMIFRQNLNGTSADTNPPVTAIKTTNFPPGTIENIDKNIINSSP